MAPGPPCGINVLQNHAITPDGMITLPRSGCDCKNPSYEESPNGSLHAFASGQSFHPLSPRLQRGIRFFHHPLPAQVKLALRTALFLKTRTARLSHSTEAEQELMSCHVVKERLYGLTTFHTSNEVGKVPPFRR